MDRKAKRLQPELRGRLCHVLAMYPWADPMTFGSLSPQRCKGKMLPASEVQEEASRFLSPNTYKCSIECLAQSRARLRYPIPKDEGVSA